MNELLIQLLNTELNELLQKCPHLIPLQMRISKDLARLDKAEDRMYYMSMELLDSFDELRSTLDDSLVLLIEHQSAKN